MFLSIFIGTLSLQTTLYLSDVPDELSTPLRALTGEHELLILNSREIILKNLLEHFLQFSLGTLPTTLSTLLLKTWTRGSRILTHGLGSRILSLNVPPHSASMFPIQGLICNLHIHWSFHSGNLDTKTWHLSHKLFLKKGGVGIFISVSTVLTGTFGLLLSLKLSNFPSLFASQL